MNRNREIEIKKNENGDSVLVKQEEVILDADFLSRELRRIEVEKQNIINKVNYYKGAYKELTHLEDIYSKELEKIKQDIDEDIFELE